MFVRFGPPSLYRIQAYNKSPPHLYLTMYPPRITNRPKPSCYKPAGLVFVVLFNVFWVNTMFSWIKHD